MFQAIEPYAKLMFTMTSNPMNIYIYLFTLFFCLFLVFYFVQYFWEDLERILNERNQEENIIKGRKINFLVST